MSKNISTTPPASCTLCPRRCGVDRAAGQTGFCGAGGTLKAARAALHFWEEPCISGTRGSGTVFFSGCTLKCCFCQNYPISAEGLGKEITIEHLAEIFLGLQEQGAHNINLVTPGQWRPWIIAALDIARAEGLRLPIVCNTGGYETVESVEAWRGSIDIWLADLKYVSSSLSAELSSAPDYFAQAKPAIEAMMAQAGHPVFDSEGILQKGVILRHLALPGHIDDSFAVLDQMAAWNEADPGCFIPSVMSQYTPFYKAAEHGIGRRITTYEYRRVVNYAMDLGLTAGYMQPVNLSEAGGGEFPKQMSREVGPRREALGRNRGFRVPFAGKLPDGLPIRFPSQSTKILPNFLSQCFSFPCKSSPKAL